MLHTGSENPLFCFILITVCFYFMWLWLTAKYIVITIQSIKYLDIIYGPYHTPLPFTARISSKVKSNLLNRVLSCYTNPPLNATLYSLILISETTFKTTSVICAKFTTSQLLFNSQFFLCPGRIWQLDRGMCHASEGAILASCSEKSAPLKLD